MKQLPALIRRFTGLLMPLLIAAAGAFFPLAARAGEAGSGHYLPGGTSSFVDMLPDRETSTFTDPD